MNTLTGLYFLNWKCHEKIRIVEEKEALYDLNYLKAFPGKRISNRTG